LLVFGPKKLPEIGRTIGKALAEFRKATDELKNTIEREVQVDELRQIGTYIAPAPDVVSRNEPVNAVPVPTTSTPPHTE
jgi:TatA/E family protein of Tat protein translocase